MRWIFFFSDILQKPFVDASQFGFIMLALIFFITGMWKSVKTKPVSG
ncbi:hypothetical protein [Methanoregula sp.]